MATQLTVDQLAERLAGVPRVRLAALPTPLEACPRLGATLGVNLLVKRDDLTGIAFGGNKARGVEFRLAALRGAITRGATVLFVHTGGLPALFRYSAQLTAVGG